MTNLLFIFSVVVATLAVQKAIVYLRTEKEKKLRKKH